MLHGSRAINKVHTLYRQYHSSVAALPLVTLVAIQQQTRDYLLVHGLISGRDEDNA